MVVEWRTKKRIANSLSPMLPTTIKIVIVVIAVSYTHKTLPTNREV